MGILEYFLGDNCEHEWEYNSQEVIYPNNIYTEDGELTLYKQKITVKSCKNCATKTHDDVTEEKVILSIERTEEV